MVNKPERVLVTTGDEPGVRRTTVMDLVDHPSAPRLYPIGRLDFNTAGLVLLTNDGTLANRLTHPRYGVAKTYRAVVKEALTPADLPGLSRRILREIRKDDRMAGRVPRAPGPAAAAGGRIELALEGSDQGRSVLVITLREGRTGNIASMLAGAGVKVRKLERIAIGPVELKGLGRGRWRELERSEIAMLKAAARGKLLERGEGPSRRVRKAPAAVATAERRGRGSTRAQEDRARRARRAGRPGGAGGGGRRGPGGGR
jgi:pseudouridine synthase